MKTIAVLLILFLTATITHAQVKKKSHKSKSTAPTIIFPATQEKPFPETTDYAHRNETNMSNIIICGGGGAVSEFPGNLTDFINANIKYPDSALAYQEEGRVVVTFKVLKDGCIEDPKVVRSAGKYLDAEALRLINIMPDWKPGTIGGLPVDSWFTMPFTFKLD